MWPFRKKRGEPSPPEEPTHHYVLAHSAFRKACEGDPVYFFESMASDRKDDFLRALWRMVCDMCSESGEPTFDISDVDITTRRIKNYPAVIVKMPPPRKAPQAHFVGIVLMVDINADVPPEKPTFQYFTLEKGEDPDGGEKTVLGGWVPEDTHVNYGEGPPAIQAAFVAAIEEIV
jgi:hypothetical protein